MDNIYVNQLINKQYDQNTRKLHSRINNDYTNNYSNYICELIHSCEQSESVVYSTTNSNKQIKYILLQCKYDM